LTHTALAVPGLRAILIGMTGAGIMGGKLVIESTQCKRIAADYVAAGLVICADTAFHSSPMRAYTST
jgi:hypothetical protein